MGRDVPNKLPGGVTAAGLGTTLRNKDLKDQGKEPRNKAMRF